MLFILVYKLVEHVQLSFTRPFFYIICFFQGVGGTVQLPKGFLPKAYELIRARGGLCISDEVSAIQDTTLS
jgi:4-aminobutyrate aminotransferase-like enzyme